MKKRIVPITGTTYTLSSDRVWKFVNEWRVKNKKDQFIESEVLCKYAQIRLNQIKDDWSHDGFKKSVVDYIYRESQFNDLGENLAKDFESISMDPSYDVLQSWIKSKSHKRVLEGNYTHSCVKCDRDTCVQLFAK